MKNLLGQIVALTKNIKLKKPSESNYGMEQFSAGRKDPTMLFGGIGITWWYTKNAYRAIENISFIICSEIREFKDCDHKTIQDCIKSTLREICVEEPAFDGDAILFSEKESLFECRKTDNIELFSSHIAQYLFEKIRDSISKWCIIYTPPRLTGESFSIESEKLHIINKKDKASWKTLEQEGYLINEIDQETGSYRSGGATPFTLKSYDYYIISKEQGTKKGSNFNASLKIRTLLSVTTSVASPKHRLKVAEKPHSLSLQIPNKSSGIRTITISEIGNLTPYYADRNTLSPSDINEILNWYRVENSLNTEERNRIRKCAHFVSRGENSDDPDSFIYYFVALDALFGNRGSVEKSIGLGVSLLPSSNTWSEKFSWLFELRNELVHGGSRFIEEWARYMKYYRHFSTEPSHDMEQLSFLALRSAPKLFENQQKS